MLNFEDCTLCLACCRKIIGVCLKLWIICHFFMGIFIGWRNVGLNKSGHLFVLVLCINEPLEVCKLQYGKSDVSNTIQRIVKDSIAIFVYCNILLQP